MTGPFYEGPHARSPSNPISPRLPRSRTQSISSDRPSTIGHSLMSPPLTVSPDAAFIASSAASQIVTNDHDSHADTWYDQSGIEPAGETALISHAALQLVNNFLDQLLFGFLQVSRATTLSALRPAVTEVLKPKLAKDAINNADEELREYLGGADEEDFVLPRGGDPSRDWDLELVWKRTRLRCMVYSSLGDLEEEDEDMYMEQENLEIGIDEPHTDVISPAVAIFLTSVLEYMGELTLTVAGQAAYQRMRSKFEKELRDGVRSTADIADRIVVEESDMERVALDRTLGRLWRGWKKRIRSPAMEFGGRPYSRASFAHSRQDSITTETLSPRPVPAEVASEAARSINEVEDGEPQKDINPADVPLPLDDNDVEQIEVPGLAAHSDDEEDFEEVEAPRPKSFIYTAWEGLGNTLSKPLMKRTRSSSQPVPRTVRFLWSEPEAAESDQVVDDEKESAEAETPDESKQTQLPPRKDSLQASTLTDPAAVIRKVSDINIDDIADAAIENAEIVRVPVSNSSTPDNEYSHKKSSSVRSARLIDVAATRSSTGSRSSSMDTTERFRSSMDRSGPVLQNATAVSESNGELKRRSPTRAARENHYEPPTAAELSPLPEDMQRAANRHAAVISESPRKQQRASQVPSHTKVTVMNNAHPQGHFKEDFTEVAPARMSSHSVRHGPRTDSIGRASFERVRTRDSDEAPPLPIQSNVASRSTHTSGSTSSSATNKLKAVRTSEEHVPNRAETVARNFEELIHSNQTITYTLTPENMRDIDQSPRSSEPPVSRFPRTKGDDIKAVDRSRSGSTADARLSTIQRIATSTSYSPTSKQNNNKPSPISTSGYQSSMQAGTKTSPASQWQSNQSSAQRSPRTAPLAAREARVPSESTADFAEFIKSTGPAGENRPAPLRNANASRSSVQNGYEARRTPSTSNKNRYQPREADTKTDTSDLAEFLRQGPPGASVTNQRGPRHGMGRSNTLESDATVGRGHDSTTGEVRHSQASTNFTDNSMPSMQSSTNSTSALIRKKQQGGMPSKMFDEDMPMPQRKTRRVRDPYAIDFSDEDEDLEEEVTEKPKPPAKEESLADFLRNYQPPPEPPTSPAVNKVPKKKSSAPSLINRFTRSYKESKENKENKGTNGVNVSESRPANSRSGSGTGAAPSKGYVPIQVNIPSGYDKYGSLDVKQPRSAGPAGRVPMKKFEPREAVSTPTRTSDLAAFLRDSEPPPSFGGPSANEPSNSADSGNFSKMFQRRKKPSVV